ncbi:MAG: ATP-binding protein [Gammaproteobacteria bacterium]|jgi:two-component system sensor histidine kinase PhoQ|nr:ATP-binding protein [Gammaproteobacteria bacterium]
MLVVASLVMVAFFGITGLVLDRAWRLEVEEEQHERLRLLAYTLISAVEPNSDGGIHLAHPVPELRLFLPGSGVYASIRRNDGRPGWDSPSADGMDLSVPSGLARMEQRFDRLEQSDGAVLEAFSIGMTWVPDMARGRTFTVTVAEDVAAREVEIAAFRRVLWSWLGVLAVVLLAAQWWVLHQGLSPLRRVAADLRCIERGERDRLDGRYPSEIQRLVDNLNGLLGHERLRRERYRHALGDLAHSLKTPLAILRGAVEAEKTDDVRQSVEQQVDRMAQIVDHQLRRAAAEGRSVLGPSVAAEPLARKVMEALRKVYRERGIEFAIDADADARFNGDADDLMEVFGNLLDNACKWAARSVRVELRQADARLRIVVDDDGPGIPESIAQGPERGQRADSGSPGHGIGLAMVRDIVELYGGEITFARSPAGGARVLVVI